jgi:hypothetical protein
MIEATCNGVDWFSIPFVYAPAWDKPLTAIRRRDLVTGEIQAVMRVRLGNVRFKRRQSVADVRRWLSSPRDTWWAK